MRIRNLWAVATLCSGIATFSSAQAADELSVNKWPDEVPCSALQKNDDGTYTLLRPVIVGGDTDYPMTAGNTFGTTAEYHIWAVNCGG
jgi:hypothetical protein